MAEALPAEPVAMSASVRQVSAATSPSALHHSYQRRVPTRPALRHTVFSPQERAGTAAGVPLVIPRAVLPVEPREAWRKNCMHLDHPDNCTVCTSAPEPSQFGDYELSGHKGAWRAEDA